MERQVKPRRADDATRITLVAMSWLIDWRRVLTVVQPDTLIRWHRKGFQLFWRWKSRPRGRPLLPTDLRRLIAEIASANRTWGEKAIASELLVKLGIHASPRTVRRYMATSKCVAGWCAVAAVEHLRAQSRERSAGVRFLRDGHGHVPRLLRVRGVESRVATDPPLECDRASDGGMDGAPVPQLA
jgi:hypothetical protein